MIDAMKEEDVLFISNLWLEGNLQAHDFISPKLWLSYREQIAHMLLQAEVYVYEVDGEILGFIGLEGNEIAGLFVSSHAQSKGMGKKLLDYVKEKKCHLSLHVYAKNQRALAFYEREQFVIDGEGVDQMSQEKEYTMIWKRKV